jgi:hypothetical protein
MYNQELLDKANESYHKVALEFNNYMYASDDEIYTALMDAWAFIDDVTEGNYV